MRKNFLFSSLLLLYFNCLATDPIKGKPNLDTKIIVLNPTPPTVKITSPKTGDKFKTNTWINVDVEADDVDGIKIIEVFLDGNKVALDSVFPYLMAFNSWTITNSGVLKVIATDNKGEKSIDSVIISIAENIPPQIKLINPTSSSVIKANEQVNIQVEASDPDGDIAAVRFFLDKEIIFTTTTPPYNLLWKATEGATEIMVLAYDYDGGQTSDELNLIVGKPDFYITLKNPLNNSVHQTGVPISIKADVVSTQQINSVEFFIDDQSIGKDSIAPYEALWISQTGFSMIKATATVAGKKATDSLFIKVKEPAINQLPIARIMDFYNGGAYEEGNSVYVMVSASDADGEVKEVEFFVNGSSVGTDRTAPFFLIWPAVRGMAEITVVASDDKGAKSLESNILFAYVDKPKLKIAQPLNGALYKTGSKLTLEAFSTCMESYQYYIKSNVTFFVNDARIGIAREYPYTIDWIAEKGKKVIKIVAQDHLDIKEDSVTIMVEDNIPNQRPIVTMLTPKTGTTVDPGATLNIRAKASDTDGSISSVSFFANNTFISTHVTPPYMASWIATGSGQTTIKAVATDNSGATSTDSILIELIQNTPPTIDITSLDDSMIISNGNSITIAAAVTDRVGQIEKVEFFVNNTSIGVDTDFPYNATWSLVNGYAFIKAVVTDDKGLKAADSLYIKVDVDVNTTEIHFKSPLHFSSYKIGDVVMMEAEVSGTSSLTLDYVSFQVGNDTIIYDSIAPYTGSWKAKKPGIVKLTTSAEHTVANGTITLASDTDSIQIRKSDFEVKIVKPLTSANNLKDGMRIELEAISGDSKNKISSIEFFADGIFIGVDHTSPYTVYWEATQGNVLLTAIATNDKSEHVSDSLMIDVKRNSLMVKIQTPQNGQEFAVGDIVNMDAIFDGSVGAGVALCDAEFFVNDRSISLISKPVGLNAAYCEGKWIAEKGYAIIKAVVRSGGISTADSAYINVTIPNNFPLVKIIDPLDGSIYKPGNKITINANASDADGFVKFVSFYADGVFIGVDSVAPYLVDWSTLTEGKVKITAKATDNLDAVSISNTVEVSISIASATAEPLAVDNWVSVYPNPAAEILSIETSENAIVQLLSIDGKIIIAQTKVHAKQKQNLYIDKVAGGSYIVKIYNDKFVTYKKVLIQK